MQAEDSAISDEGESQFDVVAECIALVAACDGQATQAIHNQFPPHKQLNLISRGGQQKTDMDAFIDAVIAHSRSLKQQLRGAVDEAELAKIDLYRNWPVFVPTAASPAPVEEHKFPAPHEKLTDWDVVGDVEVLAPEDAEAEVDRLIRNRLDGFDVADEISGLSQARMADLTHAIHRKKGRMRRERMTGAAPLVDEEAALDHLMDLLARRGV